MTKKLNPKVKKAWLAALRSGEYKQTQDTLKNRSGACCCLGVLCELAVKAKVIDKPAFIHSYEYDGESGLPPAKVYKWANLTTNKLKFKERNGKERFDSLAAMNDHYGLSFKEIADIIEEKL